MTMYVQCAHIKTETTCIAVYIYRCIQLLKVELSTEFSAIFIYLMITFRLNENLLTILMRKENVQF